MHEFTVLRDQILPVLDNLPPEEAQKARASLDRMVKSSISSKRSSTGVSVTGQPSIPS